MVTGFGILERGAGNVTGDIEDADSVTELREPCLDLGDPSRAGLLLGEETSRVDDETRCRIAEGDVAEKRNQLGASELDGVLQPEHVELGQRGIEIFEPVLTRLVGKGR